MRVRLPRVSVQRLGFRLCLAALVALEACGGGGADAPVSPPVLPPPPPPPVSIAVTPTSGAVLAAGTQTLTATVTNGRTGAVTWSASGGTLTPSGASATWTAPVAAGTYTVTATSTDDASRTASASFTVAPVSVVINATTATVPAGGTRSFSGTIAGAADTSLAWTASAGTLSATRGSTVTWTAPASGGAATVTVASVADPSRSAAAAVTVTPVSVSVVSSEARPFRGEPVTVTATVTGAATGRDSVTWTSSCVGVATGAVYTLSAPVQGGACTITAASRLDPSRSATTALAVRSDWIVRSLDDTNDGTCSWSHCSLREAITAANTAAGADTIRLGLSAALRTNAALNGTIVLTSALPVIRTPMAVLGANAAQLTIDAAGSSGDRRRVLQVDSAGAVLLRQFTLRGGVADEGAGLLVRGPTSQVRLEAMVVRNNTALLTGGGGVGARDGSTVELIDVNVVENRADNPGTLGGAGLGVTGDASMVMRGGSITGNSASVGGGGGAGVEGATLRLEQVTIADNSSRLGGAGVAAWTRSQLVMIGGVVRNNASTTSSGAGGGIFVSTFSTLPANMTRASIVGTRVEDNTAVVQGGGLFIAQNAEIVMDSVRVTGNRVTNVVSSSTAATAGGGIAIASGVRATLSHLYIANNAVPIASSVAPAGGGGMAIIASGSLTTVTLSRSTIAGNSTGVSGGGMAVGGNVTLSIVNSTISGNRARIGGGIVAESPVTMTSSTIAENQATLTGPGLLVSNGGAFTATHVILANNRLNGTPANCALSTPTPSAGFVSNNYNLGDDATCSWMTGAADKANQPAGLSATLSSNGGFAPTHAVLAGSAAINAGLSSVCPATDQRGAARVGVCDLGAFEFGGTPPAGGVNRLRGSR